MFRKALWLLLLFVVATVPLAALEPAAAFSLNSEKNGPLSGGQHIWFRIATPADGNLAVTLNTSGSNVQLQITTPEQAAIVKQDNWGKALTLSADGLLAGNYYVRLYMYGFPHEKCTYSLKNVFQPAPLANDGENNDTSAAAQNMPLNSTVTGHIGYDHGTAATTADASDWWRLDTRQNGTLRVDISHVVPVNLQLALFKADGNTTIANTDTQGKDSFLELKDIPAGTYYVKVTKYAWNFTSYTLKNTFTAQSGVSGALSTGDTLAANRDVQGAITGGKTVWYKIPVTADGDLSVTLKNGSGKNVQLVLTTPDKKKITHADSWGKEITLHAKGLLPGDYYAKLYMYGGALESCSFSLRNVFAAAPLANDPEPDDDITSAKPLPLDGKVTGHVGYSHGAAGASADTQDIWQVTVPAAGDYALAIEQSLPVNLRLALYTMDNQVIAHADTGGKKTVLDLNKLKPGTYYAKVSRYAWSFTPYTLMFRQK